MFASDGSDIKTRAIAYPHYQTGPHKSGFVHVVLKILAGRTAAQKQALSACVMAQLDTLALPDASLTVEVVDMDRASYAKRVGGT